MSDVIKPLIALGPQKEPETLSISELYHENTKLHPDTLTGMILETYSKPEMLAMARGYKQYANAPKLKLPEKEEWMAREANFDEVIASRRTVRNFADTELSLTSFSKILYQSYGNTGELRLPDGDVQKLRSAPSGGALYPAEIYLGIRRVSQVPPGIYHYNVPNHELELLIPDDPTEKVYEVCCRQEFSQKAAVVFLISGVFQRTKRKYGERGYRYVLLDVGHLGQNIYLACTALKLAVMTTCGFFDDRANSLLNLDGIDESMLYAAFIGNQS